MATDLEQLKRAGWERKETALRRMVDHVLDGSTDRIVIMTPVVDDPEIAGQRYFMLSTCGPDGFRTDQIIVSEDSLREDVRMALIQLGRPIVVHDCDDELYAIKMCETLWPGEKVTRIRRAVEAERKGAR